MCKAKTQKERHLTKKLSVTVATAFLTVSYRIHNISSIQTVEIRTLRLPALGSDFFMFSQKTRVPVICDADLRLLASHPSTAQVNILDSRCQTKIFLRKDICDEKSDYLYRT
jgi:hypothetical protein